MQKLKATVQFVDALTEWLGKATSIAVLAILGIGLMEVVLRYFVNRPTNWAWEVNGQLLCLIVSLGAAYSSQQGYFISVDVFYKRFPQRLKEYADVFALILTLIFCIMLLWQGTIMWIRALSIREVSNTAFASPLYPIKFFVPLAALLVMLQALVKFYRQRMALKQTKSEANV